MRGNIKECLEHDVMQTILRDLTVVDGNDKVDAAAASGGMAVEEEYSADSGAPMGGKKNRGEGVIEEALEL